MCKFFRSQLSFPRRTQCPGGVAQSLLCLQRLELAVNKAHRRRQTPRPAPQAHLTLKATLYQAEQARACRLQKDAASATSAAPSRPQLLDAQEDGYHRASSPIYLQDSSLRSWKRRSAEQVGKRHRDSGRPASGASSPLALRAQQGSCGRSQSAPVGKRRARAVAGPGRGQPAATPFLPPYRSLLTPLSHRRFAGRHASGSIDGMADVLGRPDARAHPGRPLGRVAPAAWQAAERGAAATWA